MVQETIHLYHTHSRAVGMATRARSKTADPGDLRKVARAHHAPRKFTEKIAMMKQREAQHAAAFAEAMGNTTQVCLAV